MAQKLRERMKRDAIKGGVGFIVLYTLYLLVNGSSLVESLFNRLFDVVSPLLVLGLIVLFTIAISIAAWRNYKRAPEVL